MKDYYAILGLDPDASPESLKVAYRRLAREMHPDRMGHVSAAERAEGSSRMAEVNEAYSALSNAQKRQEYDIELRRFQAGVVEEAPRPVVSPDLAVEIPTAPRPRAVAGREVISSVVREFSSHVQKQVLADRQTFAWRLRQLEGFDWALESSFWSARYVIALRGFATADRPVVQKFTNYSSVAIARYTSWFKRNFFVFLLAFQRIQDPDYVSAQCRLFSANSAKGSLGVQTLVVMLDVAHGRSLTCGPRVPDKRVNALLGRMGFSRM